MPFGFADDAIVNILRSLIGQENIDGCLKTFDVILQRVTTVERGVLCAIANQKEMERRADIRHKEILSLFEQIGVRPKSDTAALLEHRTTNGVTQ